MSESKLQTKVLGWLKKNGFWAIKVVVCNKNGVMDVICCSPTGTFIGIELKYDTNQPTPLQLHHIAEVKSRGGIAFVAWDLETVIEKLKGEIQHEASVNTKTNV